MAADPLFTPLRLPSPGTPQTTTHRIIHAPLTRLRTTTPSSGLPILPRVSTYYTQRCAAPGTLLLSEACIASPRHADSAPHMPGIYNGAQAAAWRTITDAVHAKGCLIYCQLWAPGRAGAPETAEAPSAVAMEEGGKVPRPMTAGEIEETVRDFGKAARRAVEEAGFDGVEVHGGNGYLVDQFIQAGVNVREDRWGGDVEGRARFAVEVARAVVEGAGGKAVGVRLSPWSVFQGMGGMGGEETREQFGAVVRGLRGVGVGYLHLVESRVVNNVDVEKVEGIEWAMEEWGRETGPVFVAGGFTPETARRAIEVEYKGFDVGVVFGRSFLANPDLVFRVKHGLPLNKYDRSTFYTPMQEEGYLDYPFSEEFKKANGMA